MKASLSILDERDWIDHEEYEVENNEDDGMEDDNEERGEEEEDNGVSLATAHQ